MKYKYKQHLTNIVATLLKLFIIVHGGSFQMIEVNYIFLGQIMMSKLYILPGVTSKMTSSDHLPFYLRHNICF